MEKNMDMENIELKTFLMRGIFLKIRLMVKEK
jgi:hypothetical protein